MTYQVLAEIRVKTRQGEAVLTAGHIIRLDTAKANPLIASGKITPLESFSMIGSRQDQNKTEEREIRPATPSSTNIPLSLVVNNKPFTERNAPPPKADIIPSEIVEPGANTKAIWRNPYPQGTPEARKKSLLQCIGTICLKAREAIERVYRNEQRQYKATPDILVLEQRLEVLQQSILKGEVKLKDFQEITDEWERAARVELN